MAFEITLPDPSIPFSRSAFMESVLNALKTSIEYRQITLADVLSFNFYSSEQRKIATLIDYLMSNQWQTSFKKSLPLHELFKMFHSLDSEYQNELRTKCSIYLKIFFNTKENLKRDDFLSSHQSSERIQRSLLCDDTARILSYLEQHQAIDLLNHITPKGYTVLAHLLKVHILSPVIRFLRQLPEHIKKDLLNTIPIPHFLVNLDSIIYSDEKFLIEELTSEIIKVNPSILEPYIVELDPLLFILGKRKYSTDLILEVFAQYSDIQIMELAKIKTLKKQENILELFAYNPIVFTTVYKRLTQLLSPAELNHLILSSKSLFADLILFHPKSIFMLKPYLKDTDIDALIEQKNKNGDNLLMQAIDSYSPYDAVVAVYNLLGEMPHKRMQSLMTLYSNSEYENTILFSCIDIRTEVYLLERMTEFAPQLITEILCHRPNGEHSVWARAMSQNGLTDQGRTAAYLKLFSLLDSVQQNILLDSLRPSHASTVDTQATLSATSSLLTPKPLHQHQSGASSSITDSQHRFFSQPVQLMQPLKTVENDHTPRTEQKNTELICARAQH
ncbi:hypothetical protein [Legionella worsleiensis]|uniref:Uncharacterized protein n=1 Tax=Legionella worsleiensis TaxID=45076 RepID=A0A0W1A3T1_9GAMM|nr:hypothetical protein [Legionella worsleiensis]KTD76014.1 hypothetical protein Lwor_2580 [Legionella worsleiensis]STY33028.1 Uncharacterised protein [Legionella worsleiensis]